MRLTVLGCAGSSYDPERRAPCSGYLLEHAEDAVVLDCGPGTFESWRDLGRTGSLRAIVVSHAHRDHWGDLATFVRCGPAWHDAPVVITSSDTRHAIESSGAEIEASVVLVEDAGRVAVGPFELDFSATTHQVATLAARVRVGECSLVYGADTGPGWSVPHSWRRAGTALLECTNACASDTPSPYHLGVAEFIELAATIDAAGTLLTHVPAREDAHQRLDAVRAGDPSRVFELAERGQRVAVRARGVD